MWKKMQNVLPYFAVHGIAVWITAIYFLRILSVCDESKGNKIVKITFDKVLREIIIVTA